MTDKERLAALREAVSKMTEGKWSAHVNGCMISTDNAEVRMKLIGDCIERDNSAAIVALRNSAEWLIGLAEKGLEQAEILRQLEPKPHWPEATKSLVARLRGVYAVGPGADKQGAGDKPEFGWKHHPDRPPIQLEAAARIEELEAQLAECRRCLVEVLEDLGLPCDAMPEEVKPRLEVLRLEAKAEALEEWGFSYPDSIADEAKRLRAEAAKLREADRA